MVAASICLALQRAAMTAAAQQAPDESSPSWALMALPTTGGTDSSGGANRGRGFDSNVFASEVFNNLTVRKTQSAEVDEGSLGATVDLRTVRPFDYRKFTATVSGQMSYNDLSDSWDPRFAALL